METLVNCNVVTDIELIKEIVVKDQTCEITFSTVELVEYKLVFDSIWDCRYAIENAYIDRTSKFLHNEQKASSVLLVKNSEYIKYFDKQVCSTRPTCELKDYIIFDKVDTVVEVLALSEPKIIKICE